MAFRGLLPAGAAIFGALLMPVCPLSGSPGDADQALEAARIALRSGNFAQADVLYTSTVRELDSAGAADSRLSTSLLELGRVRAVEGRCGEATDLVLRGIRILKAAPQADPLKLSEAWAVLAKSYNCQRLYSKAETALGRALASEESAPAPRPDRVVELLAGQGEIYEAERRLGQAEAVFRRAQSVIDRDPRIDPLEAALLRNNFGMLLRMAGRTGEAEASFSQGLAQAQGAAHREPALEISLEYNLAALEAGQKRFREAAAHFESAVWLLDRGAALPPRSAGELLRDYAACLRKLGGHQQAKAVGDRASALLRSQTDGDGSRVVDVAELARRN